MKLFRGGEERVRSLSRAVFFLLALFTLTACEQSTERVENQMSSALIFDAAEVAAANHLVVFVPGVLSSIQIFDGAHAHLPSNAAPAFYRLPGLDGTPLSPWLDISQAAQEIATLAESYSSHNLTLVGYSGGAAIVLEASQLLSHEHLVNLALISPVPAFGGGLETRLRSTRDLFSASIRSGSFALDQLWPEYWKLLAFGRANYLSGARQEEIEALFSEQRDQIVIPRREISNAHTQTFQNWDLGEDFDPSSLRIGVFYGAEDPVFSESQTQALTAKIGGVDALHRYPDQGHILPVTEPNLFRDIFSFAM
ncbi:MAG: alpha/beta hydrolase [Pseudomonadota bacterium]